MPRYVSLSSSLSTVPSTSAPSSTIPLNTSAIARTGAVGSFTAPLSSCSSLIIAKSAAACALACALACSRRSFMSTCWAFLWSAMEAFMLEILRKFFDVSAISASSSAASSLLRCSQSSSPWASFSLFAAISASACSPSSNNRSNDGVASPMFIMSTAPFAFLIRARASSGDSCCTLPSTGEGVVKRLAVDAFNFASSSIDFVLASFSSAFSSVLQAASCASLFSISASMACSSLLLGALLFSCMSEATVWLRSFALEIFSRSSAGLPWDCATVAWT
mmetsp:Transcript_889/g.3277  ORF Transcript_889/g.3277 Transcript_889/m.3277 type:complete len:277 (+) Transcript_889:215-1045(+)